MTHPGYTMYLHRVSDDLFLAHCPGLAMFYVDLAIGMALRGDRECLYTWRGLMRLPVVWNRN